MDKMTLIKEINLFNTLRNTKIQSIAEDYYSYGNGPNIREDNVQEMVFDKIFKDTNFIKNTLKSTESLDFKSWVKEISKISDENDFFIIINEKTIIQESVNLFEMILNEYDSVEEESSSYYYDEDESFNE